MTTVTKAAIRDLGEGLVLRHAISEDSQALEDFNATIHEDAGVGILVRDLLSGGRPGFAPEDFTVVEETGSGKIVSSLCLATHPLSYGGTEILAGQVELVGTLPEFRRRGLIRAQMETAHRWSAERGAICEFILGIPHYYRQFGYEMTMEADCGRKVAASELPVSKEDGDYHLRAVTEEDAPLVGRFYDEAMKRYEIHAPLTTELWRYQFFGRSEGNCIRCDYRIIETGENEPVGWLALEPKWVNASLEVNVLEILPGHSWHRAALGVFRELKKIGERHQENGGNFKEVRFMLGLDSPLYVVFPSLLKSEIGPYSYYVRVGDVPKFLRSVAPTLERRLADSPLTGHTGELKISFYRDGVRMAFEDGKLKAAEAWTPAHDGDAAFPGHTFVHLLMGRRTAAEIRAGFPDCWFGGDLPSALLDALFPKRASKVWLPI
jgi:predicted N-acetyltransferase YhbS